MELIVLNNQFEELGRIDDFLSLQWTRKYYETGDFELNLANNHFSLLDQGVYIYRKDVNELAVLNNIESTLNPQGNRELKVSGKMVEILLNDRIIESETNFFDNEVEIAWQTIKKYFIEDPKRVLPCIELGNKISFFGSISKQVDREEVGSMLYELLKEKELSQRLRFDYEKGKLFYEIWQGKDRTMDQMEHEWMIFSDNNETISEFSYSRDDSNYRNVCYVIGDELTVEVDHSFNQSRKEMAVKSSISRKREDDTEMSEEEYIKVLRQEGIDELESRKIAENFSGSVHAANLKYRADYDLGDLCTCYVQEIGKMADKRIVEIREVYESGNVEINPIFGEEGITVTSLLKKAR